MSSILNHPCSFVVCYYLFGVFHLCKALVSGFLQFKGKFVDGQNTTKYRDMLCIRATRLIRPAHISGFASMKRLGVFLLLPGCDASPSQGYPLSQEHNTMSPAMARSGGESTEATVPPHVKLCFAKKL